MSTDIGLASDLVVYQEQFYSGVWEGISQVVDGFNTASQGAIQLVINQRKGDYVQSSFFQNNDNVISHRDTTSVSAADDIPLTQAELVAVKIARKFGPIAQTYDAWRKVGKTNEEMSFIVGQMMAAQQAKDYINSTILALTAAMKANSTANYDATGQTTKTLTHQWLVNGLAKMGDMSSQIICFVMHSKPYFDLIGQAIADKIFEVAGAVIYSGNVATFNRPTLVIDSPALHDANGSATDTYNVLGLTAGAAVLEESEKQDVVGMTITGLENLVYRIQAEYAFNLAVKGFAWSISSGHENPNDASLGTSGNWGYVKDNIKKGPGTLIKVQ